MNSSKMLRKDADGAASSLDMTFRYQTAFTMATGGPAFSTGLPTLGAAAAFTPSAELGTPNAIVGTGIGVLNQRAAANQEAIVASVDDGIVRYQWHLGYLGDLATIWQDYDGTGVSYGIYDSGVDTRLSAFDGRYDASKEVTIGGKTYHGGYTPASGPHGTAVAGLIAAARDGEDTIGVAYGSTITSVNIFDPYSGGGLKPGIFINASNLSPFFEALDHYSDFDIVNNSWGPSEVSHGRDANRLYAGSFANVLSESFAHAADTGRDGLGTIVVKSAGNYGLVVNNPVDPFNVDGELDSSSSDRHIIAVAAYREVDGNASAYSTRGAHLLISAPSNDYVQLGGTGVWTTDVKGRAGYNIETDPNGRVDYTDSFGGTSAAAPIVSGVVGLMLDANGTLGWRDVQNILATSAVMPVKYETGQTSLVYQGQTIFFNEDRFSLTGDGSASTVNGGGYHFSSDYGYGAIDAYSAVRMAEVWSLFGEAKTSANEVVAVTSKDFDREIVDSVYGNNGVITTPTVFKVRVTDDVDIEHLDLKMTYTTKPDGFDNIVYSASFRVTVTSPDGTAYSVSLSSIGEGYGEQGTLVSEALGFAGYRGEMSKGLWTVSFEDLAPSSVSIMKNISLEFSGSAATHDSVHHYTSEFATMAAIDGEGGRYLIADTDGGNDWLDMSAVAQNVELSLTGGDVWIGQAGFGTSPIQLANAAIENIVTGDGDDYIRGSAAANEIHGMRGNDRLLGMRGDDVLVGGAGDDVMDGGQGADVFVFALAADTGDDEILRFRSEDLLAFDGKLADPDADGRIKLNHIEYPSGNADAILRLDDVNFGDRVILRGVNDDYIHFVEEKDGLFYYGIGSSGASATTAAGGMSTMNVAAAFAPTVEAPDWDFTVATVRDHLSVQHLALV